MLFLKTVIICNQYIFIKIFYSHPLYTFKINKIFEMHFYKIICKEFIILCSKAWSCITGNSDWYYGSYISPTKYCFDSYTHMRLPVRPFFSASDPCILIVNWKSPILMDLLCQNQSKIQNSSHSPSCSIFPSWLMMASSLSSLMTNSGVFLNNYFSLTAYIFNDHQLQWILFQRQIATERSN